MAFQQRRISGQNRMAAHECANALPGDHLKRFTLRQRLSRHDRLIDRGLAGDEHAVDRDALAGKDAEDVSGPNLFGGNDFLFAA